jgi:hypothetical protein
MMPHLVNSITDPSALSTGKRLACAAPHVIRMISTFQGGGVKFRWRYLVKVLRLRKQHPVSPNIDNTSSKQMGVD